MPENICMPVEKEFPVVICWQNQRNIPWNKTGGNH